VREQYDYVVVGSGAGGGTVAARLAEAGMTVCVLEAGSDGAAAETDDGLPEDYQVPAFHPFASENKAMAWNFFVDHYTDPARQRRDWKLRDAGIFYPRAGTLGGCTAHNALIFVRPHDSDWDGIARLTGDRSWRATEMNRYFRTIEECRHRPLWRWIAEKTGFNPTGHGWNGWLPTELALPREAFGDDEIWAAVDRAAHAIWRAEGGWLKGVLSSLFWALDPNNRFMAGRRETGMFVLPLSTDRGMRKGTRERLRDTARRYPDRLHIECDALATRVVFDAARRATGVAYLKGRAIYGASPAAGGEKGEPRIVSAAREVILSGGAFNTPQLLMLSGIGQAAELARHGIETRVELPGVGRNLQDRYEVSVVNRMKTPWPSLAGARFTRDDKLYREWQRTRTGMYRTNGAALAFSRRSAGRGPDRDPDLFFMALLTDFRGYYPGYSDAIRASHDRLSWAILKAHTINRAGTVTLRSAEPTEPPRVDFHYFDEGDDAAGKDLKAVVEGVRFVRAIANRLREIGLVVEEELPGSDVTGDDALAEFVRDSAWGHHASCSCAIGPREAGGVLASDFKVYGTQGLRVVDASVFPRIPGFFIASAVMTIGEKAAAAILAEATPTGS
jgi:choline dehydrogenase-like flavoprotein